MPTPNEFSDYRFGSTGDESYKQTDREMDGGVGGQGMGPLGPQPSTGQYPNTFDRPAGSEPMTPSNYPETVFGRIAASGSAQWYTQTERQSVSGEYGQSDCKGMLGDYLQGDNMVPDPVPSKQFSSDKEGDPKKLVRQATSSIDAHSDLLYASGLNQPVATYGTHAWLRDELANPGEREPGNAEPVRDYKVPRRQSVKPPID
jgi:hypothetical protein